MLGIFFLLAFALVTGGAAKFLILTFVPILDTLSVMDHEQGFELAEPEMSLLNF